MPIGDAGRFYMVQRHIIERDMVAVDITRVVESPPKRRLSKRAIKPVHYQPKIATVAIKRNRFPNGYKLLLSLASYTTGVLRLEAPLLAVRTFTNGKPLSTSTSQYAENATAQVSRSEQVRQWHQRYNFQQPTNLDIDPTDFLVTDLRDVTQRPMVINPVEPLIQI